MACTRAPPDEIRTQDGNSMKPQDVCFIPYRSRCHLVQNKESGAPITWKASKVRSETLDAPLLSTSSRTLYPRQEQGKHASLEWWAVSIFTDRGAWHTGSNGNLACGFFTKTAFPTRQSCGRLSHDPQPWSGRSTLTK